MQSINSEEDIASNGFRIQPALHSIVHIRSAITENNNEKLPIYMGNCCVYPFASNIFFKHNWSSYNENVAYAKTPIII